jgi:hypothetical protein
MDIPVTDSVETVTVSLEPGFFSEQTARGAKSRWKDGDRVRFKDGLPQKLGGWLTQAISNTLLPTAAFQGIDRKELEWTSLDNSRLLAQGTSKKLYLVLNNVRYDITPVRLTVTLTNPFTTVNGSPLVTVAHAGHGAAKGDFVRFTGATAVGGLTISGEYSITTINDGNSYVITASGNASSGATGGGSVVATYDISIGYDSATQANGWGTCGYGQGTYGTRRGACSALTLPLRTWSLDNWGEDLLACPRGGGIYWWDKTTGPLTRAVLLDQAPPTNEYMLVSDSGDQVICLGAFDAVANTSDRMLIRTSDIGSLTVFTINDSVNQLEANSVFEERLSTGSRIINGIRTRNGIFIFTDKAQYLMQPDSSQIYRVGKLAEGSSVLGPNAAIEVDGTMYGMGRNRFVKFDGVFGEMPCPVWGTLFDNKQIATSGGDPYFSSVTLLEHFDGTNGQTTATDSSSYAHALTNFQGGSLCDTATFKWGTGSLPAPSGVPKAVTTSSAVAEFSVSAGLPFTLEGWINVDSAGVGSNNVMLSIEGDFGVSRPALMLYMSGSSTSTMRVNAVGYHDAGAAAFQINGAINFSCNTWHHVAVVRSGTTYTLYLDGVADGTATTATTLTPSTGAGVVATAAQRSTAFMVGWIDEVRFTNGIARYTSNFAVPTEAFPNGAGGSYGINNDQGDKVYCWYNKDYSEIWWHYPSSLSTENDRYIILNISEPCWYYGTIARSAGSSGGTAYAVPFATSPDGTLSLHETGTTDNGAAMNEFIESYDVQIGQGKSAMHVRNFVPDMKRIAGTMLLTLKAKNRPQQSSYVTSGPYSFTSASTISGVRSCGRQIAIRLSSTTTDADWRTGDHTFEIQPDGER